jgi:RimJ/RimL family protein N-acetyltransferase
VHGRGQQLGRIGLTGVGEGAQARDCRACPGWGCGILRRVDYLIVGERVGLGPLRRELVPEYTRWINDPEVREGVLPIGFHTEETELEWYERCVAESSARIPLQAQFTAYDLSDDVPIGNTGLFSINHLHGTATFGILLGERRGQGLGTEIATLALRWAFDTLGLHNVMLTVLATNERGIVAYRRAGFEPLGVRRSAIWSRGERIDEIHMQAVRA